MSTLRTEEDSFAFAVRDPNLARVVRAIEGMARSLPWVREAEFPAAVAVISGWRRAAVSRLEAGGLSAAEAAAVVGGMPEPQRGDAQEGRPCH